jgi:hypothetical protein
MLGVRHDEGVFPPDRDLLARPEFDEQHEEVQRWPRSLPVPHSVGSLEAWMVLYGRRDLTPGAPALPAGDGAGAPGGG